MVGVQDSWVLNVFGQGSRFGVLGAEKWGVGSGGTV